MSLSRSELIEKLEAISSKYSNVCAVREKMNTAMPTDNYERRVALMEFPQAEGKTISTELINTVDHSRVDSAEKGAMEIYENVCEMPKEPPMPEKKAFNPPQKPAAIGVLKGVAGFFCGVSIFFLLGRIFSHFDSDTEWTISVIITLSIVAGAIAVSSLLASFVLNSIYAKKRLSAKRDFDLSQQAVQDQYNRELTEHGEKIKEYKKREEKFIEEYRKWRECYLEHLREEDSVKALLERDRESLVKEIERTELMPAISSLEKINDIITDEYLPVVDKITSLVKSGRADTLKEAINLYEELRYKERQLEILREQEEQRAREEELRRMDEQRRHEEEMQFRRAQEYQRQLEERLRREEENRRYEEEKRQREQEEARRQREEERNEARLRSEERAKMYADHRNLLRQCNSCAMLSRCSVAFRRSNCPSYQPK